MRKIMMIILLILLLSVSSFADVAFYQNKGTFYIKSESDNDIELVYTFEKNGPNELYSLTDVYSQKSSSYIDFENLKSVNIAYTDRLSPYIVSDINVHNYLPKYFTGGWHSTNNTAIGGDSTAFTDSYRVIYDGENVVIEVSNKINGYNTDYPVLKEEIIYTIEPKGNINIDIKATTLTDVVLERYYGIMFHHANVFKGSEISYNSKQFSTNQSSQYKGSDFADVEISGNGYSALIRYNDYGMFSSSALNKSSIGSVFTTNYGKTYFNLLNGLMYTMNKDDSFHINADFIIWKE